jgi:hypothetical protein
VNGDKKAKGARRSAKEASPPTPGLGILGLLQRPTLSAGA